MSPLDITTQGLPSSKIPRVMSKTSKNGHIASCKHISIFLEGQLSASCLGVTFGVSSNHAQKQSSVRFGQHSN